ncbi:MAG: leucine-rich repeat domain-containing protein [Spirochaetes bacterium]|nr:leucine-rich repeat domain-containing protein [Spirochaetota bacterium]
MSDLHIISQIGEEIDVPFKRMTLEELNSNPEKWGIRGYVLDDNENVIALRLDNTACRNEDLIVQLKYLHSLYMRFNDSDKYDFITQLPLLKELHLSAPYLDSFFFLRNLTGLTSLDLSHNKISDWSFSRGLTGLTSLDLRHNKIRDVSFLRDLKGLTSLYLSDNGISDWSFLRDLKGLTSLDLSYNRISDGSFLRDLKDLTSLDLSGNKIRDVSFLRDLKGLTSLYLSDNGIRDVSFLRDLKGLTSLELSGNGISDGSFLRDLKDLTSLDLSGNKISDVSFLRDLTGLTSLDLRSNKIRDVSFLRDLTGLTSLDLRSNKISDWSFLRDLTGLTSLDLSYNGISDVSFLRDLTGLTSLDLSYNGISDGSFLRDLTGLTSLDLRSNKISDWSFLRDLTGLTSLYLSDNKISDISFLIYAKNVLYTDACLWKINSIPSNILNDDAQSIRRYLLKTAASSSKLYEAKTLFVGQPEAGKTSLMRKLIDPSFEVPQQQQKSTLGIDIVPDWSFPLETDSGLFKAHFWDFGGQTIQCYIHQFFLTERSLYILLLDDRKEEGNLDYWFNIIRVLGGHKCPVIVVRNEKNINTSTGFDEKVWSSRYGDSLDLKFYGVNLADTADGRLTVIERAIMQQLRSLPQVGQVLPGGWVEVRNDLAKMTSKNHITLQEMCDLCEKHGIVDENDKLQLCGYLNDLGIIQHFRNDITLENIVYVNTSWLTKAVYQILADKKLDLQKGKFTKQWLFDTWGDAYSQSEKNDLLLLMQKKEFDLIYPIDGDSQQSFIAPRLLPNIAPEIAHNWGKRNLSFRYRYPFMPEGIISRFIVRMYKNIAHENNCALVWANGVILDAIGCRAIVKKDLDTSGVQVIDIDVRGDAYASREFLTYIRKTLDDLHRQSFRNAARELLLPCCCDTCKESEEPSWFDLSRLQKYLEGRKYQILCENITFKDVDIAYILSNVVSLDQLSIQLHEDIKQPFGVNPRRADQTEDEIIRFIMNLDREQRQKLLDYTKEKKMPKQKIFVSYSHMDSKWREIVWPYLHALSNMGFEIDPWIDNRQLKAGQIWRDEIQKALDSARIGLCLISMNFLNSDFIMKHELPELLKKAEEKGTPILFLHVEQSIAHLDPRISQFQHVNNPQEPLEMFDGDKKKQAGVLISLAERMVSLIKG